MAKKSKDNSFLYLAAIAAAYFLFRKESINGILTDMDNSINGVQNFNVVSVDPKTKEEFIEQYDFSYADAHQWIKNNKKRFNRLKLKVVKAS